VPSSRYEEIVEKILSAVSLEQGLYLSAVCLLKTKSIPKTTSGKISRASCRKAFLDKKLQIVHQWSDLEEAPSKPAPSSSSASQKAAGKAPAEPARTYTLSEVKAKITQMVKELGNLDEIRTDAVLLDAGLSSAATTELSGRLSKEFGVKIRPTIIFTSPTIDDVSARVVELAAMNRMSGAGASAAVAEEQECEEEEQDDLPFVRPEAFIAGWGIATPFPVSTERFLEIDRRERQKLGQSQELIDQMAQLVTASRIKNRHSCHPFFLPKGKKPSDFPNAVGTMKEDIYGDYNSNPPTIKRMQCYSDTAVKMCVAAAEKAVKCWGKDKSTITHILTTCTSGWTEPGIGCGVIKGLGLSQDIQKAELNFNGCFCGATCLRVARDIIRAGDANAVLIVACEVATTHFDWNRTETERMIAQSLFADGAASIVVAKEGVWRFSQTGSAIVPDSGHLLGLRPPMHEDETNYIMTLSKFVAPSLYAYFSKGHGKDLIKKLYNPREPKPALAIHPGGPRILEAVGDVFFELGWQEDSLQTSFDTFGNFGNLGSSAMLFVLTNRLTEANIKEDKLITMAFGPGVTVEYAQFERATPANSNAALVAAARAKHQSGDHQQQQAVQKKAKKGAEGGSSTLLIFIALQTFGVFLFGMYCLRQAGYFAQK
jgi:predicted naringenin-chalcone synthase/acyl carrier protein